MNDFDLVVKALSFATHKHRHQRRKNRQATPYIEHPIAVMRLLWDADVRDPVVLAGALLHDTLEDTDATPEELEEAFGPEVAEVVAHCTDDKDLPKGERKRRTIEHVARAPRRARLVKLADRIANCGGLAEHPPKDWSATRIGQYHDWSRQVVDALRGTHLGMEAHFDSIATQDVLVPWTPEASARDGE